MASDVNSVSVAQQRTSNQVEKLSGQLARLAGELNTLIKKFDSFTEEERLAHNMHNARAALIDVRAQRDREFGHYNVVRRGTIGMLQAMDIGTVPEGALQAVAWETVIETPGYWLAPVQVALASWVGDDKSRAEQALREAMVRDDDKTALFFSLVLSRHRRYEATAQWMREYLNSQEPEALTREFTVVLDAVAQGALGGLAQQSIKERCVTWFDQLWENTDIVTEQAHRWRDWMERNQRPVAGGFTILSRMCPEWDAVQDWLSAATVYGQTEKWLRDRLEVRIIPQDSLPRRVDSVLDNLVTAYDKEENSLRQQEAQWAAVVKYRGDHALASQMQAEEYPTDEPLNFLALLTSIGLTPRKLDASEITQQFAIRLASEWITGAVRQLSDLSRSRQPSSIKVNIEGWQGELPANGDYKAAAHDLCRSIDEEVNEAIGRVTTRWQQAFVLCWLIVFLTSLSALPFRLVRFDLLLVVAAAAFLLLIISSVWLRRERRILPTRREEIQQHGERRKSAGMMRLKLAAEETTRVFRLWETELAKQDSLLEFIREQAAQADPLSITDAGGDTSVGTGIDPPNGAVTTAEHPARNVGLSAEGSELVLSLPDWDLLPPH